MNMQESGHVCFVADRISRVLWYAGVCGLQCPGIFVCVQQEDEDV
jgi:hypothetical protein